MSSWSDLDAVEHLKQVTKSPGTWMRVVTFNGGNLNRGTEFSGRLRSAIKRGLLPPGQWEVVARQDKREGESYVYAKYERPTGTIEE